MVRASDGGVKDVIRGTSHGKRYTQLYLAGGGIHGCLVSKRFQISIGKLNEVILSKKPVGRREMVK